MQKARHHGTRPALTACRRMVSGTLSLPCSGCFSPFPHGTCSLSVSGECLALADGPAGFTRGSTCPALLRILLGCIILRVQGFHLLWRDFPDTSPRLNFAVSQSYNPEAAGTAAVWASPRSLATTGGITFCFLFLQVLRCFSSLRSPHSNSCDSRPSAGWVAPFRNPRINGRLHLPAAFRSLPRLSSPSRAKASTYAPLFAFASQRNSLRGAYSLEIALRRISSDMRAYLC